MQPQDPNNPAYAQQPQPQQSGYAQPSGGAGLPFALISVIAGGVGVLAFGVLFGFVASGSSYWLLLTALAIGAAGAFLGFKSLNEGGSLNKLALAGFVLSVVALSLSLAFTTGLAITAQKAKSAAASYSSSY